MSGRSVLPAGTAAGYLAVVDNATGAIVLLGLADAAALTGIAAAEIERALAESGVCQSIDFSIYDTVPAVDAGAGVAE
ncbi:MAG TPA: hypothetical protein VLA00_05590 [Xanthobacteraceae bacterium]|nr:hypothetical protein [Xanthobacteraceae bacterium]